MNYSQPYKLHWELLGNRIRASFAHPCRKIISHCQKELSAMEMDIIKKGDKRARAYFEYWCLKNVYSDFYDHLAEQYPELLDAVMPPECRFRKWKEECEMIKERGWVGG